MAHFYPEISDDFHNSLGEYKIFQALKNLSNSWNVYYSLTWQKRSNNGRITWGEADFAIFNPSYGILVIEVKSGGIRCENGDWYQKRLDTEEEKTDIPEDTAIETNSNKTKRGKEMDRNKHSIYMLQDFFKVLKGKKKNLCQPSTYLAKIAFKNINVQS